MTEEEILAFFDHPPVKEGFVRIYEDHTGRGYEDVPESELQPDGSPEWELMQILNEEIRKETLKQDLEAFKQALQKHITDKEKDNPFRKAYEAIAQKEPRD